MAGYITSALASPVTFIDESVKRMFTGWSSTSIPNLTGKVALVTGCDSGIGLHLLRKLADNGADVYLVSHTKEHGQQAVAEIAADLGDKVAKRITVLECDLSVLAQVDELSSTFRKLGKPLHLLVLNAGVFHPGPYTKTKDGFELTLEVNYFSHVRLTNNLLDIVTSSGPSRIVYTASFAEMFGKLDFNDITGSNYRTSGMMPYSNAKLYGLMWAKELQDRLRAQGAQVDVFAIHPGGVRTALTLKKIDLRYWTATVCYLCIAALGIPAKTGATSITYASTEPSLQGKGFKYYGPGYFTQLFHTHSFPPLNPQFYITAWRRRVYEDTLAVLQKVAGSPKWGVTPTGTSS